MDREQALNGAALISYSLLYFHHSYYIITFHNPAQGDKNRFFSLFPLLPLLSTSPPCGIAILPVDPTAIHLGLPSPQSDNRLYLDALFWGTVVCVCVSVCAHVFIQRNSLSISMSPYATQAQWSPSQRALSCVCVLYWLSRRSMQHFYLWFISRGLQAHWVLFDWVLWPLGFKVGSRERQSIPVQVTWPSLREIVLSVYFCLQKKKTGYCILPPLTHTHRALNQQSSLLHPTIQASTVGEQRRGNDCPTWH